LDNVNEKIRSLEYQLDGVQKRKVELLESIKFVNLDSIFNQRKQEAEEVNSTIEKLKLNVNNLSKSLTNTKDELQKFLDRPNEVILNNEISTLESDYEKINSLLTKMNEAQIDANTYVEKYNAYFSNKESIQKSITETETLINVINRYSNEYTDLNNKIVSYNKILEALHISKGLPSIISSKILAVIQDDCNDMIKIMFKEQFAINFVNTEKELSLMVFNSYNGEISEYNMLSGGEQSIIKMVLSLSLLKFKIGEASSSILRLDEIDAFLDDESSIVLGEQNNVKIGERATIEIGGNSNVEIKENSRVNVKSRTVITLDDDVEIWIGGRNIMSYLRNIGL
jgi:DNA repair exonuclease SbcCD ATPase subunit